MPQDVLAALFGNADASRIPFARLSQVAAQIRAVIARLVDERLAASGPIAPRDDILQAAIDARDPEDGSAFSRDELIDQITVLFLAGHETSASALTWSVFVLSQQAELADAISERAIALAGREPLRQDVVTQITDARNAFREVLRLYPPAGFISRVATAAGTVGSHEVDAGSLIVISPWLLHRHHNYWKDPDIFDPRRSLPRWSASARSCPALTFPSASARVCAPGGQSR